jgi:hypothetical protein
MSDDHLQPTARFAPVDLAAIHNDPEPGNTAAAPLTGANTTAANTTVGNRQSEPVTEPFLAAVPRPQPFISLGPYERQASALAAGNLGMTNGQWEDYDTQGVPGRWYIVPSKD